MHQAVDKTIIYSPCRDINKIVNIQRAKIINTRRKSWLGYRIVSWLRANQESFVWGNTT